MPYSVAERTFLSLMAILGWFALITQYYINLQNESISPLELGVRYMSYFTLTTNILIATCCTLSLLNAESSLGKFFISYKTRTALTVYILIVSIIYNAILRFQWNPHGLQRIVDELLHSVIPVLFLIYWVIYVFKCHIHWKETLSWLAYPLLYLFFIMIRGMASGFYPYFFINVTQLGLGTVLINSIGIALGFFVLSMLFVATGNYISKDKKRPS
ncbi:hypothetical protein ADIARSV_3523 [Arcticibacter svalbardensis MN12-7]|uniref:Integral membrane protein n=1 Tax=Arcticibacter svalbardensis MN12-7 TaxID=1150600 RepID=R9GN93_9SPHI|nr:Pr6Pr family membrane protein [Arcticibacter svalbardensis]EOR93312.1 hypothetical protein ADIARSV_3523 [Arcticibacter svalbardensis MN12-7]